MAKTTAVRPVKGTRDWYPEQMAFRRWLYEQMSAVSQQFGYQEWEGPLLETLELYAAKSGEELVKEQSFTLTDRKGEQVLVLRPELTPTLARMVAQQQRQLGRPIRWYSFGPFWRYEQPQKGRTREFFQWNIDLLGVESPQADAELAAVAATFFRRVGLSPEEVRLQVNNRRLVDAQLRQLGVGGEQVGAIFRLIDKREKMRSDVWRAFGRDLGLDDARLARLEAMLQNRDLWRESEELVAFFQAVDDLGVADYVEYDPTVIRGLDYYTGTVFEARDRAREYRAILGGGRYDNLVAAVGGERLPGVGFAMGDLAISLMLEAYGKVPPLGGSPAQVLVTVFSPELYSTSARLSAELRNAGLRVELYPEPAKLDRQLRYAEARRIPFAAIVGPDELSAGQVALRDMSSRLQELLPRGAVAQRVKQANDGH